MLLIVALVVCVFSLVYFVYLLFYTKNMNKISKNRRKYIDINAFRTGIVIIGLICITGYSIYSFEKVNALGVEQSSYINDYVSVYDQMTYNDERILEIYTTYNIYFGGMYLDGSNTVLLIREDIPLDGLNYLNSSGLEYQLVKFNYHELLSARIQIEKVVFQTGDFISVGIDDIDNCVLLTVATGTSLPEDLSEFIESGILQVIESDYSIVLT